MAVNIYFWIGLVLCLCAMIILTYAVARVKNMNEKNTKINKFVMLIGSDTISTLITGILMLLLGTTDNYVHKTIKSTTEVKCTTSQLLVKLSAYLIPVLTGITSVPAWIFQLYKCTDCNEEKHRALYRDRKMMAIIISQWIIPLISILSTLTTEPDMIQITKQSFNTIDSGPMLTIDMGESFCSNFENISHVRIERILSEDINGLLLNRKNITSAIVNRIYNIVKQHGEKNISNDDENQLNNPINFKDINTDLDADLFNNKKTNSLKNLTGDHSTGPINYFSNIADIISTNKRNVTRIMTNISKKDDEGGDELLMGEYTLTDINILKLMENYTWPTDDRKGTTKITNYNIGENDENFCFMACQPPKGFLKKLFFLLLLLNLFLPLAITATLQAKLNKNMEIMELKEQQDIKYKRNIANILHKNTVLGMATLSPTLVDTVTRTLLSIDIPHHLSAALLALAMVGTAARNLMGLYLIDAMQNITTAVHPIEEEQASLDEPHKTTEVKPQKERQLKVQDIENEIKNQETIEKIN